MYGLLILIKIMLSYSGRHSMKAILLNVGLTFKCRRMVMFPRWSLLLKFSFKARLKIRRDLIYIF